MRAGRMRSRIILLEPTVLTDEYGAETKGFAESRIIRAERASISANRSDEVGEHFADFRTQFHIRFNSSHNVSENWRLKELDGELYTVVAVIPNIVRQMKTLICEKVNE